MRMSHSIGLLSLFAATMAISAGCGSDYGGDPPSDASSIRDGAHADGGDAARQGDAIGAEGGDAASDADGGARVDTSVSPDVVGAQDGSTDTSTASDASDARDMRTDATDARMDMSVDSSRSDGDVRDSAEGGSVGPDGTVGPRCGNGVKETGEECDDGNTRDFDGCTSLCTDHIYCDCCVTNNSGGSLTCNDVDGDAESGPRMGTAKSQLCNELYVCLLRSRCGFDDLSTPETENFMECYCGVGNTTADQSTCKNTPAGPCVAEMEAGMETEGATWQDRVTVIHTRMTDNLFGGGKTMERWLFESIACPKTCGKRPEPDTGECPNPPDGGTPPPPVDATVDTKTGNDATADVSAPPDGSPPDSNSPPDAIADGGGGIAVDGGTIDKDCSDCILAATLDPYVCDTLTDAADGGPASGISKKDLCWESLNCIHRTNCHANASHECYCGTVDLGICLSSTTAAAGPCKAEFDRSLEVPANSPGQVALDRIVDTNYAGGYVGIIATVEGTDPLWQGGCRHVCIPYTPTERRDR